jgi:Mce-associated membrane protein
VAGDVGPAAVTTVPETSGSTAEDVVAQRRSWPPKITGSPVRLGLTVGLVAVLGLSALTAWLGHHAYQQRQQELARTAFLQAGRQGALDLTSVDYTRVEADVQRVLAASTGSFRDDFQRRSPPFIQEVLRTKTKAVGSIAEAGLESADSDQAKVLVAVKVTTTREGSPDQRVKGWRMRIDVQRAGSDIKIANVEMIQ